MIEKASEEFKIFAIIAFRDGYEIGAPSGDWPFRPLEQLLGSASGAGGKQRADLEEQLKAANNTFFKA